MTQEEKDMLLKDLCARLYTGTMVNYNDTEGCDYELTIRTLSNFPEEKLKCYLRPLSSMTDEEKVELFQLMGCGTDIKRIDFYISHHFDYRGLIPMGLALEATEDMYKVI